MQEEQERDSITTRAYIRCNFGLECWVEEIIQIILKYYVKRGGSLYVFGDGEDGVLGIEDYVNKFLKTPTLCPPFHEQNAIEISAGTYHTLILDIYGHVWSCGNGENGELGNGKEEIMPTPQKLNLSQQAVAVATGHSHSLVLLKNGYVHSFGSGSFGQLGHGTEDYRNVWTPKTIESLTKYKIVQIAAGEAHSTALTETGHLFCFGATYHGQCGIGQSIEDTFYTGINPTKAHFDAKITFIACGENYTLLITMSQSLYSFGFGEHGHLGHGSEKSKFIPTLVEGLKDVKINQCCGGDDHTMCIDEDGVVWSFGTNTHGQLGLPNVERQLTPKKIDYFVSNNIKAIDCSVGGGAQSCVISTQRHLYLFGRNDECQLGLENQKEQDVHVPTQLQLPDNLSVIKASMGWSHTALIAH